MAGKIAASSRKRVQAALSASSKKNPLLAFASVDGRIEAAKNSVAELASRNLSTYGCDKCETRFVAEAGMQPFCVTCSSEEVKAVADVKDSKKLFANVKEE